jgi:hypothetical protein
MKARLYKLKGSSQAQLLKFEEHAFHPSALRPILHPCFQAGSARISVTAELLQKDGSKRSS